MIADVIAMGSDIADDVDPIIIKGVGSITAHQGMLMCAKHIRRRLLGMYGEPHSPIHKCLVSLLGT